jgi:hypothetical protein
MVKSASRRSYHYDKKIDGDVINFRITQQKAMMVEQTGILYAEQTFNEDKIKDYLEHIGMFGIQQHHYMNFGQEMWSLSRTFKGQTLRLEAEIKADKWLRRGLNATHLIHIAALFGIDLTA